MSLKFSKKVNQIKNSIMKKLNKILFKPPQLNLEDHKN